MADQRSSYLLILKTCASRGNVRWTSLLKCHGTRQSAVNNFKVISHICIDWMEETHFLMSVCQISKEDRNVSRRVESTAWIWLSATTELWLVCEGITKISSAWFCPFRRSNNNRAAILMHKYYSSLWLFLSLFSLSLIAALTCWVTQVLRYPSFMTHCL